MLLSLDQLEALQLKPLSDPAPLRMTPQQLTQTNTFFPTSPARGARTSSSISAIDAAYYSQAQSSGPSAFLSSASHSANHMPGASGRDRWIELATSTACTR